MAPPRPRFVRYLRVSTDGQGRFGLGLEAQRQAVAAYVTQAGGEVVAEFREVENGKRADRPQLAAALASCRTRRAVLVIAKLDRLARNNLVRRWEMPERLCALALREKGGLVIALASGFAFFDPETGAIQRLAAPEAHLPGNRMNDGKCDRRGRFWAGTMDDSLKDRTAALYRLDPDLSCHQMETGIGISNSLAWSPDNRTFYYADSLVKTIFAYDFDLDSGAIRNRRVFANCRHLPGTPDGSTIDAEGFLWNAHWDGWKLVRYAPDGRIDREVKLPVQKPTSCMFGGPDLATLYVTSAIWDHSAEDLKSQPQAGGLFALDVGVRGLPEPRFAG